MMNIKSRRVLVVDDDWPFAELLVELCQGMGFEARAVRVGESVWEAATSWGAAAILLDLMMPEVDGFDILHQLRDHPATHDLPVIVISAIADTFESEPAAQEVQAVFPKPLNIPRFLQTLKDLTAPAFAT
ncbi:MAG: response regulator [Elusimicrobia bacterium]|nr:response regulator [Elusimicrobiota bacterium]